MYERQEGAGHREYSSRKQKYAPWPEQTADVDAEGPNKHQGRVIGAVEPCSLVVTNADVAPQICHSQRKHAAGECHQPCAHEDTEDP